MPRQAYPIGEASRVLGVSLDTLRRWDRAGRIRTERDSANRRIVPAAEIDRLTAGSVSPRISARNRLEGVVQSIHLDGLLAEVELEVRERSRVVAIITRESAEELGLSVGITARGIVKATSVMIER